MTNRTRQIDAAIEIVTDTSRTCPTCGRDSLEFFVTLRRAKNPEAARVETRGPRAGQAFHVAAECPCGAVFEVRQAPPTTFPASAIRKFNNRHED